MSENIKKILVVMPLVNTTLNDITIKMLNKYLSPGFELGIKNLQYGGLEGIPGRAYPLSVPYVIQEILRGAAEGYDAIIPSCFADPGISETRAITNIPVVGPGESALHLACMLGYRIGLIELGGTQMAQSHGKGSNWARQLVRSHGLLDRVISIRSIRLSSRELINKDHAFELIYKTAKASLEKDGAEVLIFGCTAIMGFAEKLQRKLNIPVVEPIVAALKIAETLLATNLSHSRLAYPSESDMGIRVEMKYPPTLIENIISKT